MNKQRVSLLENVILLDTDSKTKNCGKCIHLKDDKDGYQYLFLQCSLAGHVVSGDAVQRERVRVCSLFESKAKIDAKYIVKSVKAGYEGKDGLVHVVVELDLLISPSRDEEIKAATAKIVGLVGHKIAGIGECTCHEESD